MPLVSIQGELSVSIIPLVSIQGGLLISIINNQLKKLDVCKS
jgi:hypothetical protein